MATINEYPKFTSIEQVPYLNNLQIKLIYAKDFTPHKVTYYEQLIKEWKENISEDSMKELLINNNYKVSTGVHGLIFITPINKGNVFMKSFESIKDAYNYYLKNQQ
jgi:queuine/archaeosine tRNA-ribosyltransferase